MNPDYSHLINMLPTLPLSVLIVIIIGWAMLNAYTEEFYYKGLLWDGLSKTKMNPIILLIIQGLHFGVLHYFGFPSGIEGMILASGYGIALGFLRKWSGGIIWPAIVHFFADITIGSCYIYLYLIK